MRRVWVLVPVLAVVLAACGGDDSTELAEPTTTAAVTSGDTTTAGASCVEQYTLETLKNRDYAFDGTISKIEAAADEAEGTDRVTFDVTKWYKGGTGTTAVRRATGFAAVTSAGGSHHEVGERLLVAGDDDFVWECGFTQSYSAEVAAGWDDAL